MTTRGGTIRAASLPRNATARVRSGARDGGSKAKTLAVVVGSGTEGSVLTAGKFIRCISVVEIAGPPQAGRPGRSDIDALDRKALQIGARIVRIEYLAVEECLLAARLR